MSRKENNSNNPKDSARLSRREFLQTLTTAAAITGLSGCIPGLSKEEFLQKYFRHMTQEELNATLQRLEKKYSQKYGKEVNVDAIKPLDGTEFGYGLDISRCIGCRRCVYGCVSENNHSRDPQIHWIQVLEMEKEKGPDLHHSNLYYDQELVPHEGHFYLPVACQQCRKPPCVKTCPVEATWQEPDGIVVIDYDWCIGCRCCMASCPYGARHFNWGTPNLPAKEVNPDMHFLGNRPRGKGVVEKCTFCIQRVRKGMYPKCVEVCPVGARKFGNLLDPESEIRYILENKRVLILKKELDTQPKFYYFYAT